ncbi:MAG: ABC transporter permease subunit [Cyanobacteria bacterium J06598_3]
MFAKLFSQLSERAFDKIGHYNPQLLREWQGRLRWRNLLLTVVLSVFVQGLLLVQRLTQLPTKGAIDSAYCILKASQNVDVTKGQNFYNCQLGANDYPLINWPFLWADVFRDLSYCLVWVAIVGGVYLLAADLAKEARRGTLNFLRMSPQSGRQILVGKLLGVPVLMYLGIGAMLPLHLMTGLMSSYSLVRVLTFYGLLGAIALCFYTATLWFTLLTKGLRGLQAWIVSGLSFGLLLFGWNLKHEEFATDWFRLFNPLHILADWNVKGLDSRSIWPFDQGESLNRFRDLRWFSVPVGEHSHWFALFALANALVLGLWFWTVLQRKFKTPAKTALGKQQSYGLTLCLSLIMMGFNIQKIASARKPSSLPDHDFVSYSIAMAIWGVALMFLLLPSKQVLLDWARYRHQRPHQQSSSAKNRRSRRSLVTELLTYDESPSPLAFAVNLGIVAVIFLLGLGIYTWIIPVDIQPSNFVTWVLVAAVLISCSLTVQWIALSDLTHWRWVTLGAIAAIILGWPLALIMVGIEPYQAQTNTLWLTTAFPGRVVSRASGLSILLALATHLVIITSLSVFLTRRCQFLGQSEWKALMARGTQANPS